MRGVAIVLTLCAVGIAGCAAPPAPTEVSDAPAPAPHPLGLCNEAARAPSDIAPGGVILLGDSLTCRHEWTELGTAVTNLGIDGDTTAGVLARLDQVVAARPAAVVLQIGVNDLSMGISASAVASGIEDILTRLRERLPSATLYLSSLYPLATRGDLPAAWLGEVDRKVREANALLPQLAARCGAGYIDVGARLAGAGGRLAEQYSADGIHLSAAGYRVVTDALRPYVCAHVHCPAGR